MIIKWLLSGIGEQKCIDNMVFCCFLIPDIKNVMKCPCTLILYNGKLVSFTLGYSEDLFSSSTQQNLKFFTI